MIKIEIQCSPEDLDGHIAALGFMRNPVAALGEQKVNRAWVVAPKSELEKMVVRAETAVREAEQKAAEALSTLNNETASIVDGPSAFATEMEAHERPSDLAAPPQDPSAKRVPGQPAPGRKRRTKEEMEEDYAYLKRHKLTDFPSAGAAISTGEARIDPASAASDKTEGRSAAAAQDEADEAAETAARATGKPTMEDLRRAVARWTEKVGSAAAIKDLRSIIGCAMIELPEAEIGAAIGRVEAAIGGSTVLGVPNLSGQPPAPLEEAEIIETPKADKDDVVTALKAYGQRYDGTIDTNAMPITKEDMPKLFGEIFGAGVTGIGSMPKTPEAYGRITAAIAAATRDNPFRRQVHA